MKHTKGPWNIRKSGGKYKITADTGTLDGPECVAVVSDFNSSSRANAELVALAPELLEIAKAYRNLLRTLAHTDGQVATYQHIESVIARAEGKD